jgi:hypothetical protein
VVGGTDRPVADVGEAQYIIRRMRTRAAGGVIGLLVLALTAGCSNPLGRQYEYEEQLYLNVDGSGTVVIDASIPAFVALRGLTIDPAERAGTDREQVRAIFESAGCREVRVGQPWVRRGRRFVQVRVAAAQIDRLQACGPLAWSSYRFQRDEAGIHYEQVVGPPAGGFTENVNWDGTELVGFKLHAPSRIFFHNIKRLEDGLDGKPDRGNILTWEQRLSDRLNGQPLRMEVRMGAESILFRTLWLFAAAFASAVTVLVGIVWLTVRRAKAKASFS